MKLCNNHYINISNIKEYLDKIDLESLVNSLFNIKRFNGHYDIKPPLSVGQHSLLVSGICYDFNRKNYVMQLYALIHDLPEAIYGDMGTHFKRLYGKNVKNVQREIDNQILGKFMRGSLNSVEEELVKQADLYSLNIERKEMWETFEEDKWPTSIFDVYAPLPTKKSSNTFDYASTLTEEDFIDIYYGLINKIE